MNARQQLKLTSVRRARRRTYAQVRVLDVQGGARVPEVAQVLLVQQDVDGDAALVGRLHEVAEQIHVREHVHHQRYHLGRGNNPRFL